MKRKLNKKLTLNKKTVANLSADQMKDARGGATGFFCETNDTCTFDCSDHYTCQSYMPCDPTFDISACPTYTVFCPI